MKTTQPVQRFVHEWEAEWGRGDYERHAKELAEIHAQLKEADMMSKETGKPSYVCFQVIRKGMNANGEMIFSGMTHANGESQLFDINRWMLAKHDAWVRFSMTPEDRQESEFRCKSVKSGISELIKSINEKE